MTLQKNKKKIIALELNEKDVRHTYTQQGPLQGIVIFGLFFQKVKTRWRLKLRKNEGVCWFVRRKKKKKMGG